MSLEMLKEVGLNVIAQIMFFVVNIFVIPWLGQLIVHKNGDFHIMSDMEKNCIHEETKEVLEQAQLARFVVYKIKSFIWHWTVQLTSAISQFLILLVTFNYPKLQLRLSKGIIGKSEDRDPSYEFKGTLICNLHFEHPEKIKWWNPLNMIGFYGATVAHTLMFPFISLLCVSKFLPSTFSCIVSGFNEITYILSGGFNIDFMKKICVLFIDIVWNKLIVGGFAENPACFLLIAILFVFSSGCIIPIIKEDKKINGQLMFVPVIILLVILANIAGAVFCPLDYTIVANYANYVGLAILFVTITKTLAIVISSCIIRLFKFVLGV